MSKAAPESALTQVDSTLAPLMGAEQPAPKQGEPGEAGVVEAIGLPSAPKTKIAGTWWLLAGAVLTSAGVLTGMRHIGMKGGMTGKDMAFDEGMVQAANRPKRDHASVIKDLNSSRVTQQVPGEQVKKNPFRLAEAMEGLVPVAQIDDPDARNRAKELDAKRRLEQDRVTAIKTELQGFKVQSILGGKPPLARISGKLVREGQKLGAFFTVTAIHGRTVEVECEGKSFELGISPTDLTSGESE